MGEWLAAVLFRINCVIETEAPAVPTRHVLLKVPVFGKSCEPRIPAPFLRIEVGQSYRVPNLIFASSASANR